MGIDIYVEWEGQTKEDKQAQYTGFSITSGDVGYLREAYHGGPYATRYLVADAFQASGSSAPISSAVLKARLPATVLLAIYRRHIVYDEAFSPPGVLHLDKNENITLAKKVSEIFSDIANMETGRNEADIVKSITDEQISAVSQLIETRNLPDYALAFVDFVQFCAKKEAESGKPCTIIASY